MKIKLFISIISIFIITGCYNNNDEQYLKLLEEQNEFLNNEIDFNYIIIKTLSDNNWNKYGPWLHKCNNIISIRDSILQNEDNIYILKKAADKLLKIAVWRMSEEEKVENNIFLDYSFNTTNKVLSENFKTKLLIFINKLIKRYILLSNKNDYRFNHIFPVILTDKNIFKKGEEINVAISLSAADTTYKPLIFINNKRLEINQHGHGIYKTTKYKPGKYSIKGEYLVLHEILGTVDTFLFETEYIVE